MIYWLARAIIRVLATFYLRWEITGQENVPSGGALILAANHVSLVDPLLAGSAIERRVHFMAKAELFRNALFGAFLRKLGAYPVKRGEADRQSIKESLRLLAAGEVIGIFPEGTRSADGQISRAQTGIAFLATRGQAPVLPVAIVGSERIMRKGARFPRPAKVKVCIGKPITLTATDPALPDKEDLRLLSDRVMAAIADLAH